MSFIHHWKKTALLFSAVSLAGTSMAVTVTVDGNTTVTGTSYPTLSGAVAYTNSQGAGPHNINITADSITDDGLTSISQAVTVDGDADNDGVPCDILVDISALQALPTIGTPFQVYMRIAAPGDVTISDLNIHPDEIGNVDMAVAGLETDNPPSGISNYNLNRVNFSGTNSNGDFIDLTTDANLHNGAGNILWTSQRLPAADTGGIVHVYRSSTDAAAGDYNITFTDCKMGMANGTVVNINSRTGGTGTTTFIRGLYGHSGQAAFLARNESERVTIKGEYSDRLKVLRCNQANGNTNSAIHFIQSSDALLVEYVDSYLHHDDCFGITQTGSSNFDMVRYCRFWHGTDPENPSALTGGRFLRTANSATITVQSCTFYLDNSVNIPADDGNATHDVFMLFTDAGNAHNGVYTLTDSIFTSDGPANGNLDGYFNLSGDQANAMYTFANCALPHDAYTPENINNPLFVPGTEPAAEKLSITNTVAVSPRFSDVSYDISDPVNAEFLLPTDAAYNTAASDGSKLVGGAGLPPAGIDPSEWMLF